MRQLDQRIAVRFHINELSRTETANYVAHRLRVAGAAGGITFTRRALTLIYQYSGGLPRRVNLLCDRALMTALRARKHAASTAPSCGKACAT